MCPVFRFYHLTNLMQGAGLVNVYENGSKRRSKFPNYPCVRMGLRGKADSHINYRKVKKS